MPPKSVKKAQSTSDSSGDSDTLTLAKAINNLVSRQEEFREVWDEFNELNKETLTSVDLELKTKREDLVELQKEYETKKRDFEIKLKQECDELKYESALKFLEEVNEMPVKIAVYNEMKQQLENARSQFDKEKAQETAILNNQHKKELELELRTKDLQHQATMATLKAEVDQLKNERKTYSDTIINLKEEIACQRELTRQVAEASKQGAIQQSFGK